MFIAILTLTILGANMSKRPPLLLKLKSSKPKPESTQETPTASTTIPPHTTVRDESRPATAAVPRITLKLSGASSTPKPSHASPPPPPPSTSKRNPKPTGSKPARKAKPTPKKRALEISTSDDEEEPTSAPGLKKIKLTTRAPAPAPASRPSVAPLIKIKGTGRIPYRPKGVGYDSEAEGREVDPVLCEGFILRMQPGPDCDTLRQAAADGTFGLKAGCTDVRMRFLTDRRGVVTVNGRHYAAILVDLPCVIEAMKAWERKGTWVKSVDICQMLMVLGRIGKEEEAMNFPLPLNKPGPELDEKTWQWASGITPPMHRVRTRRFRKRISVRTVMQVEADVEALLREDAKAIGEPIIELLDENELREKHLRETQTDDESSPGNYSDQEAEGDIVEDDDNQQGGLAPTVEGGGADDDELHAAMIEDFENALAESGEASPTKLTSAPVLESPSQIQDISTPATPLADAIVATPLESTSAAPTPGAATTSADDDEDFSDDVSEASEALEAQQERQRQREEISDLEAAIKQEQAKAAQVGNALLKKKLADKIRSLQGDLEVKMAAMEGAGGG